jgi:hypothetical protein
MVSVDTFVRNSGCVGNVNAGQVANSQWRLAEEAHSVHIHFALGDLDPL